MESRAKEEAEMKSFDLVDKVSYLIDKYNAPYLTIKCKSRNEAKTLYLKSHPEVRYIDILCRNTRNNSFEYL